MQKKEAVIEVEILINENNWKWTCEAVQYYYTFKNIDYKCDDYSAVYAWK